MADITDPEVIRFVNEVVRPLAEDTRSLFARLVAAEEVSSRLLPTIGALATDLVVDGREAEGVTQLTGLDIHTIAGIRTALLAMATPEVQAVISKARSPAEHHLGDQDETAKHTHHEYYSHRHARSLN